MGRQLLLVGIIALSVSALSGQALAQPNRPHAGGGGRRGTDFRGGPAGSNRQRIEQFQQFQRYHLSPEERQIFQRNAERWLRMSPEQQKMLREREQIRRQQLRTEADAALRQSGLRLDQQGRDMYEQRYFQERRRIDRQLRQEAEEKRQQQLPQINEKLKKEFQPQQNTPVSSVAPSASTKPSTSAKNK